jgi:hypothetical protein
MSSVAHFEDAERVEASAGDSLRMKMATQMPLSMTTPLPELELH